MLSKVHNNVRATKVFKYLLLHACSMEKLTKKLQSIGLTQNEARVYLFLLEYQEAKTGLICSKLKIPNSHIYQILEKLLDKGIISYKIINNIKIFRPVDPESLYSLFREKEFNTDFEII